MLTIMSSTGFFTPPKSLVGDENVYQPSEEGQANASTLQFTDLKFYTPTPSPTLIPEPTATPGPTAVPQPTATPGVAPTATPTPTPGPPVATFTPAPPTATPQVFQ